MAVSMAKLIEEFRWEVVQQKVQQATDHTNGDQWDQNRTANSMHFSAEKGTITRPFGLDKELGLTQKIDSAVEVIACVIARPQLNGVAGQKMSFIL